jgi:uncharacterized protein
MLKLAVEFCVGLMFGLGLLVSGMANPAKVLGFLDLFGAWDPSLALVMAGAIVVGVIGYSIARKRPDSLFRSPLHWPQATKIDQPLLIGSALFGTGWGLAGFCPGPAIVAASSGQPKAVVFVLAMLIGMWVFDLTRRRENFSPTTPTTSSTQR